jgi:hypothetical protein
MTIISVIAIYIFVRTDMAWWKVVDALNEMDEEMKLNKKIGKE